MILFILPLLVLIAVWFYHKTLPQLSLSRKIFLTSLRFISLAIIFLLLLNPILRFEENKTVKPLAIFLHDNSESMQIVDQDKIKQVHFDKYYNFLQKDLEADYQTISYNFAGDLASKQESSNLSKSLESLLKKHPIADIKEIFLFSDGWFDDEDFTLLEKINIPINCVVPELKLQDADLAIVEIIKNETAYLKEINPLQISLQARNYLGKAQLSLNYGDKTLNREVDFSEQESQMLTFDLAFDQLGLTKISAEISTTEASEQNLNNNRQETALMVNKHRQKVLMITDRLNWDLKYINSAIKADDKFSTILLTKKKQLKEANEIVNLSEKIRDIDLLIISNQSALNFSRVELQLLAKYHDNGGSILFIGEYLQQLKHILPSNPSRIRSEFTSTLKLTKASNEFASFDISAEQIPPLTYKYVTAKPEAKVLASYQNEENSPCLIYSELNSKILQINGKNLWRWQMQNDGSEHDKFIVNLVNWLSNKTTDNFMAFVAKSSFLQGEKVDIELIAYDEKLNFIKDLNAKIKLKKDGKAILEKYLIDRSGKHSVELDNLEAGKYSYTIIADKSGLKSSGEFIVIAGNREADDIGINLTNLSYISSVSGGKLITENNFKQPDFKAKSLVKNIRREIPLYKKLWLIILFISAFCLELFWRKRWGLL